jgi:UDP-2,3-diacylglucosamine hydrolase
VAAAAPDDTAAAAARPALFISDLHLSPARPRLADAFHAFCAGAARNGSALYVLGDLFDAWIGDDQLREPFAAHVAASLAGVAAAGVPVAVMRGNRDLLLGDRFASAARTALLPDAIVVDLFGTPTLLMHGDTLCTDDVLYQRYRAWSHDAARQQRFLALPYAVRRAFAAMLRRLSQRAGATKTPSMTDVTADAVSAALRAHGVAQMIHGHTHRPARHELTVDGRACVRWVLPDWYEEARYLEAGPGGAEVRTITR